MSAPGTLEINYAVGPSSPQTFAELGITAATLTEINTGESSLEITLEGDFTTELPIAPFKPALYRDADGTPRWIGWLDQAPRAEDGNGRRITLRLAGPHRWHTRAVMGFTTSYNRGGMSFIGANAGEGSLPPIPFADAWNSLLAQTGYQYSTQAPWNADFPITGDVPPIARADIDVFSALQELISYCPQVSLRWMPDPDYSPGNYNPFRLDATDIPAVPDAFLSTATHALSAASFNPRYDLLYDKITVYYIRDNELAATESTGPGGDAAALGANRTKVLTFDTTASSDLPDEGLADILAAYFQRLHLDGRATAARIDWDEKPGGLYGFTGANLAALHGHTTVLHTISRDLFRETTEYTFGVRPEAKIWRPGNQDKPDPISLPAYTSDRKTMPYKVPMEKVDGLGAAFAGIQGSINGMGDYFGDQLDGLERIKVKRCDGKAMFVLGTGWVDDEE